MKRARLKWAWQFALGLGIALPAATAGAASFKHENRPQNLKVLRLLQRQRMPRNTRPGPFVSW